MSEPGDVTPLDPDEAEELRLSYIATRAELNVAEATNIAEGLRWAARRQPRTEEILADRFLRELHRRMFCDVWTWAGRYRITEKNIGVGQYRWMEPRRDWRAFPSATRLHPSVPQREWPAQPGSDRPPPRGSGHGALHLGTIGSLPARRGPRALHRGAPSSRRRRLQPAPRLRPVIVAAASAAYSQRRRGLCRSVDTAPSILHVGRAHASRLADAEGRHCKSH
jgi:hypothetical protein